MAGLVSRYNNGYSSLNMLMMIVVTGVAIGTITGGGESGSVGSSEIYWPFLADAAVIFIVCAVSMCVTILYGSEYNENMQQLESVLQLAILRQRRKKAEERQVRERISDAARGAKQASGI